MKQTYLTRALEPALRKAATEFPILVLTGPRQTGKSTLLRHLFPDRPVIDLENSASRALARRDPGLLLENLGERGGIIDEIQYAPDLLSSLKEEVDRRRRRPGRFLLTGSQMFPLMQGVSQSLAGRVAVFELLGLSAEEEDISSGQAGKLFDHLHRGFYPDPAVHGVSAGRFYSSYISTYLERDVRQVKNVHDLALFQAFLELLAARVGSPLNLNDVTRLVGISFSTARQWLSVLESTRIVYALRPYTRNVTKRVVRSPKLYFTDTGLLAHLLKYPTPATLQAGPMAGTFFENFMVMEAFKLKLNTEALFDLSYYRDSNGNEMDLVVHQGARLMPVEFKLAKTLRVEFSQAFDRLDECIQGNAGHVVSLSDQKIPLSRRVSSLPWWEFTRLLRDWSRSIG